MTNMDHQQEAQELFDRAVKQANQFFVSWNKEEHLEDAETLFVQACSLFKVSNCLEMVLQTYEWIIKCETHLGRFFELAKTYEEMGHYLQGNPTGPTGPTGLHGMKSAHLFELAADLYLKENNPNKAHQLLCLTGQLYEEELDMTHAMACYRQAIRCAKICGVISKDSMSNLAQLEAINQNYADAIEVYEDLINLLSENLTLRFSIRTYLFYQLICYLANDDLVGAKKKLVDSSDDYVFFGKSTESQVASEIISAVETCDPDRFVNVISEYDDVSRFPPFLTTLLLRIKKLIRT